MGSATPPKCYPTLMSGVDGCYCMRLDGRWPDSRKSIGIFLFVALGQTSSVTKVVEAGGIEPPSEDLQALATTRLFRDF